MNQTRRNNIHTTNGEIFSHDDHCRMALLVYARFGRDMSGAADAWRRLLQNDCADSDFEDLVNEAFLLKIVNEAPHEKPEPNLPERCWWSDNHLLYEEVTTAGHHAGTVTQIGIDEWEFSFEGFFYDDRSLGPFSSLKAARIAAIKWAWERDPSGSQY